MRQSGHTASSDRVSSGPVSPDVAEVDVVRSAVFAWCAERRIGLRTQAGISAASAAIELFERGYRTPDALFHALHGPTGSETTLFG